MTGLPNTRFYLDDGTGTFPDDITLYVRLSDGFSITRGRADTENAPTASVLNLVVNNATGAFTPGATVLANPTTIKVDQRIKVVETVNGTAFTRFVGYVKTWAVSWLDVAETTSIVRITATDAQAKAERRVLRSFSEEEILATSPNWLYPLQEPSDATSAGDTSSNQHASLTQAGGGASVAFGDTSAGWTGAKFAAGKYLTNGETFTVDASTVVTYIVKFRTSTIPGNIAVLIGGYFRDDKDLLAVNGNFSGALSSSLGNALGGGGTVVTDGLDHVAALVLNAGTGAMYLDGAAISDATVTPGSATLRIGDGFVGDISYVAAIPSALSGAQVLTISQALLNSFANESGTARITRLAGYAGISTGTLDTSLTSVPAGDIAGQTAWQAIQDVADAEMGVAYIAGDGTLTFHNRQRVTTKAAPDLTQSSSVKPDAEPVTDDQDLLNYLEVSSSVTQAVQVVRNASSETAHGRYSDSKTYLVSTDGEALDRGNWLVATRAEPGTAGRYPGLTINLYGLTPVQQAQILTAIDQGCWLRLVNMPSQTIGGTTVDAVIEGYTETQNGDTWELSCNVVTKTTFYPPVWILGTSALGVDTRLGV